ncbi:MAG: hypothetical protein LAT65_12105 [Saccharospirillum sp.]|nr:hypothetical protein [Saccharospirillum sp.]
MDNDKSTVVSVHLPAEVQQQLTALVTASGVTVDEVVASALVDAIDRWREAQQRRVLDEAEFERLLGLMDREWSLNSEWFAVGSGAVNALSTDG